MNQFKLAKLLDNPRELLATEWGVRLRAENGMGPSAEVTFRHKLGYCLSPENGIAAIDALKYASSIEYHHKGVSSNTYLEHPLRMATFVLQETSPSDVDTVILALIHNVLEVSEVNVANLASRFDDKIANAVESLTVDRNRLDAQYKRDYYNRLSQGSRAARIVKVLDKLDNVFMICFNPNADIRRSYLDEIAQWVQPMADADIPSIAGFMRYLTETMYSMGYQDKRDISAILLK